MRYPCIKDVAAELSAINDNVESECDIRLQVYPNGDWKIRTGDASYDQDHRGTFGASSIPGYKYRINSRDLARDLLDQVKEQS